MLKRGKGEKDRIRSLHWHFRSCKMQLDKHGFSFKQDVHLMPHGETELHNRTDVNELQRETRTAELTDRLFNNTSKHSNWSRPVSLTKTKQ